MAELTGQDFVARVPVYVREDGRSILAAAAGEVCDRVPTVSLGWLAAQGAIALRTDVALAAPAVAAAPAPDPELAVSEAAPETLGAPAPDAEGAE